MIIIKLMGGLGNQMFQYAIGRRLSLLQKTSLKADVSFLNNPNFNGTPRKFELDIFSSDVQVATEGDLNKFTTVQNNKYKKGIQRVLPFIYPYYTITEPTHRYNAAILNSPGNCMLIGYWQTEKYFLPVQDVIRKDFGFKKPLEGINKTLAEDMARCNSVSVHIRRGDYIQNAETNRFHGICSAEYYSAAIALIKKEVENIHLYIFSDEVEWVKANMHFDALVTYVDNNNGDTSYIDMQLMSLCRHNIIANSSFSWWGAWLNSNPGKIVVAPAKWFNDASIDVNDVIPEEWHKL